LDIEIETWDGEAVDPSTWNFARHCEYFKV